MKADYLYRWSPEVHFAISLPVMTSITASLVAILATDETKHSVLFVAATILAIGCCACYGYVAADVSRVWTLARRDNPLNEVMAVKEYLADESANSWSVRHFVNKALTFSILSLCSAVVLIFLSFSPAVGETAYIQYCVNGIGNGAMYALAGVGFAIVFGVGRFLHFAHAGVIAVGAYGALVSADLLGAPVSVALVAGIGASVTVGITAEVAVYRQLDKRAVSPLGFLIASLGVYILAKSGLTLAFGKDALAPLVAAAPILRFGGVAVTSVQVCGVGVGVAAYFIWWQLRRKSMLGLTYAAVCDSRELAEAFGMSLQAARSLSIVVGSALAGFGAVLMASDLGAHPNMGFRPLLVGVAATLLCGPMRLGGVFLVCLVIGVLEQVVVGVFSAAWDQGVVAGALVVALGADRLRSARRW